MSKEETNKKLKKKLSVILFLIFFKSKYIHLKI